MVMAGVITGAAIVHRGTGVVIGVAQIGIKTGMMAHGIAAPGGIWVEVIAGAVIMRPGIGAAIIITIVIIEALMAVVVMVILMVVVTATLMVEVTVILMTRDTINILHLLRLHQSLQLKLR
jgi:hypothetical protein